MLAAAVPAGMLLGLLSRPYPAELPALPAALGRERAEGPVLEVLDSDLLSGQILRAESGLRLLVASSRHDPLADPLLYWSAADVGAEELPADAVLLGALTGTWQVLPLPAEADPPQGTLILYSLGHGAVRARVGLGPAGR